MRHSFYNLNAAMVDDLCELLTCHRRADLRGQVAHKFNNVYCFMGEWWRPACFAIVQSLPYLRALLLWNNYK